MVFLVPGDFLSPVALQDQLPHTRFHTLHPRSASPNTIPCPTHPYPMWEPLSCKSRVVPSSSDIVGVAADKTPAVYLIYHFVAFFAYFSLQPGVTPQLSVHSPPHRRCHAIASWAPSLEHAARGSSIGPSLEYAAYWGTSLVQGWGTGTSGETR